MGGSRSGFLMFTLVFDGCLGSWFSVHALCMFLGILRRISNLFSLYNTPRVQPSVIYRREGR
jgi:hypothetical protein